MIEKILSELEKVRLKYEKASNNKSMELLQKNILHRHNARL